MSEDKNLAEENIKRLLEGAYRQEGPEAGFVQGLKERMMSASDEATQRRSDGGGYGRHEGESPTSNQQLATSNSSTGNWQLATNNFHIGLALGAIAALVIVGIGLAVWKPWARPHDTIVNRGGQPAGPVVAPDIRRSPGLAPAPATRPAAPVMLAVGESLSTPEREQRRLALPDGSILYVDGGTSLKLETDRRISMQSGRIFLEVAQRQGQTFDIITPDRQVTALGTKLSVIIQKAKTAVLVTQGKVKVSGFDLPLLAGQQLAIGGDGAPRIVPAPRAAHELEWTRKMVEAAQTPLVPESEYDGGALIVVDPRGQEARLSLRKFHVDVHIEDGFARTTIDQTYFNHEHWRQEGTFYFPLPADASLSRLAMYVDGKLMEGGMAERQHAAQVYESIVYTRRDPALLEWVDGSTFKMRVFPLEARQEKRIVLSYVQKLPESYGQADFRFPSGHSMSLVNDWSFHAVVKNGALTHWASPSHALAAHVEGNDLVLSASAKNVKPDRDVAVRLENTDAMAQLDVPRFSHVSHEGYDYLMLRYRPNLPQHTVRQQRDWVFLFESSGNRDPLLARAQAEIIRTLLQNAEHDDTFAIVTAGTRTTAFAPKAVPVTAESIASAMQYLDRTHLVGALDLEQALRSVEPFLRAGRNAHLVHVGTGIPTLGQRQLDKLAGMIPAGSKYVGVGVGKNWSRQFMKDAATRTGGFFTQINPDEPIAWRAFELSSMLNAPRLMDVRVTAGGAATFLAYSDAIAQGEEVCAVARLQPGAMPKQVTLAGAVDGQKFERQFDVKPDQGGGYMPRLWAKLEIERLLAENAEGNKNRIIELSKAMYVMSPYTSLLVLENEEMYKQFNVDRGRKDHWANYPAPDKIEVVTEPDPNNIWRPAAPKPEQAMTAEQVMGTILVRIPARAVYWPNQPYYGGWNIMTAHQWMTGGIGMGDISGSMWGHNVWFDRGWTSWEFSDFDGDGDFNLPIDGLRSSLRGDWSARYDQAQMMRWADRNKLLEDKKQSAAKESMPFAMRMNMRASGPMPAGAPAPSRPGMDARFRAKDAFFLDAGRKYDRALEPASADESRMKGETFAGYVAGGIRGEYYRRQRGMFQRPSLTNDWRVFGDLLAYAPGMNTSRADILAAVEAEAQPDPAAAPGRIDPEAKKLIDQARSLGWRKATLRDGERSFAITFNGAGQFAWERTVADSLHERAACDGKTLVQLYDELGLGARRPFSRFHFADLAEALPCLIPAADDLARGCDVTLGEGGTVIVTPRNAADAKTEDGKPSPYYALHIRFSADGQVSGRQLIEKPSGKTIYTQSISPAGLVVLTDGAGKEVSRIDLALSPAAAPQLALDTKGLVVLPLPFRTREHLLATRKLEESAYANWSEEDALSMAGAYLVGHDIRRLVATRFFAKGDRRIGFYVLMLATGQNWAPGEGVSVQQGIVQTDPVKDHPGSALAQYIADQVKAIREGYNAPVPQGNPKATAFIPRLAAYRWACMEIQSGRLFQGEQADRQERRRQVVDLLSASSDTDLGFGLLAALTSRGDGDRDAWLTLAKVAERYESEPGLRYYAAYEAALALYRAGEHDRAKQKARKMYQEALDARLIPPVDYNFRNILQTNDGEGWTRFMRDAASKLIGAGRRMDAIQVAWQCSNLGDPTTADSIIADALAQVPDEERFETTLSAIECLWHMGQQARADAMLQPLLKDEKRSAYPELWRLASAIAGGRGMMARAATYDERALDLEYQSMSKVVNLQLIRRDYGQLLGRYQQLADAIITLEAGPPETLVSRVVRYADRWRAMDPDDAPACQAAARILNRLGEPELAWEYLTTPLAEKSNEAAPWASLAQALRQEGQFDLADRAYATAFEVEPTNAQMLWDRAQLLMQQQRVEEARGLFRQLAAGTWQPRFENLQRQAREYVK